MVEGENPNEVVNLVTKTIISAADASIPKSGLSFPKNRKPWWNKHCTDTNRNQRKAWNVFRRHPTSPFKELKASHGGLGRKVNVNTGLNLCPVLIILLQQKICGITLEGRAVFTPKNASPVCERMVRRFVILQKWWMFLLQLLPLFAQQVNYTEPFLTHKNRTERIKLLFQTTKHLSCNTDLTIFELHTALSVIKHTSPGPDGVTYSMLPHLSEHSLLIILYMFNRIWKEHIFPDCWKHAFIIPVPKPVKIYRIR
ncbi:hypothetical protein AVEN_244982-1 [Araneus ventricosus]|uniref:RNA-directed DNA polymerase from transposon X-element n=1 Tax=Araneus ventricosus TaxID=182803 RepID=A0A4Y2F8E3_ARAVE|nr:hypothetical protein AVEN_244982-1 [Araneus ventricosus]